MREAIPDYRERTFYISGPQAMVQTLRDMLRGDGRPPARGSRSTSFPDFA